MSWETLLLIAVPLVLYRLGLFDFLARQMTKPSKTTADRVKTNEEYEAEILEITDSVIATMKQCREELESTADPQTLQRIESEFGTEIDGENLGRMDWRSRVEKLPPVQIDRSKLQPTLLEVARRAKVDFDRQKQREIDEANKPQTLRQKFFTLLGNWWKQWNRRN